MLSHVVRIGLVGNSATPFRRVGMRRVTSGAGQVSPPAEPSYPLQGYGSWSEALFLEPPSEPDVRLSPHPARQFNHDVVFMMASFSGL